MTRREASYSVTLPTAFVMTFDDAKRVWDAMERFASKVSCSAKCVDKLTRKLELSHLKDFSNVNGEAIVELTFTANAIAESGEFRSSTVTFKTKSYLNFSTFEPIDIRISGPESELIKLKDSLLSSAAIMKPWYSAISRIEFIGLTLSVVMYTWLTAVGVLVAHRMLTPAVPAVAPQNTVAATPPHANDVVFVTAVFVIAPIAIGWLLNKVRRFLFPLGVISISKGKHTHEAMEKVRWIIVGLLVTSSLTATAAVVRWILFQKLSIG